MARLGAELSEIAEAIGVTEETLQDWQVQHPELAAAIGEGKADADATVERSLFRRATGYSHPEDKVYQYRGEAVVVPSVKNYPPDVSAAIFWLKNRKPKEWREKQDLDHGVAEELADVMKRIRGGGDEE